MRNLLVVLMEEQTIPNIQFIKEFRRACSDYLFITTEELELQRISRYVMLTCGLPEERVRIRCINPFSPPDIRQVLDEIDYEQFDRIRVNVCGGSKVASLTAMDFFKELGADIYYLAGMEQKLIRLFPRRKNNESAIRNPLTLKEYLSGYGFEVKETKKKGNKTRITPEYTTSFFDWYISADLKFYDPLLDRLREYRNKKVPVASVENLGEWLEQIRFPLYDPLGLVLNKYEIRYLTGNWFEEYIYNRLRMELQAGDNLKTGLCLKKYGTENEFDIMLLHNGQLYTVECKTSFYYESDEKEENIVPVTLYKTAALHQNLGLYSHSSVFTLDSRDKMDKLHCRRAKIFGIRIFFREDLLYGSSLMNWLGV